MAAVGRLSGPEWKRYADPATELEVVRLTDPAFASGMTAPHLRQFTRRGESLLYWSERYSGENSGDAPGARQAFILDLKQGESRQLTDAAALDPSSLSLSPDERSLVFFDGHALHEMLLSTLHPREIHVVPQGAVRTGLAVATDGAVLFAEREKGRSRV